MALLTIIVKIIFFGSFIGLVYLAVKKFSAIKNLPQREIELTRNRSGLALAVYQIPQRIVRTVPQAQRIMVGGLKTMKNFSEQTIIHTVDKIKQIKQDRRVKQGEGTDKSATEKVIDNPPRDFSHDYWGNIKKGQ